MDAGTKPSFSHTLRSTATRIAAAFKLGFVVVISVFVAGAGTYIWYGASWATKELNDKYLGQCVNVGGSAVGRVVWITPSMARGAPYMSLDDHFRPVAHGKVQVVIGDTGGLYDAADLTLSPCPETN